MLTVKVIEEDIAMRTLLAEWLSGEGHAVDADAAVAAVPDQAVDLVVVDLLNLPTQGAETVGRVKLAYPRAAFIGISTQLSQPLAAGSRQAQALGVQGLVPKPCRRDELLQAVAGALGAKG